jgi:hypothetical protein
MVFVSREAAQVLRDVVQIPYPEEEDNQMSDQEDDYKAYTEESPGGASSCEANRDRKQIPRRSRKI